MTDQNNASAGDTGDQNKQTGQPSQPNEHMVPKSRLDDVIQQRKEAEEALGSVLIGMLEDIPEDKRDLVPDLAPAKKIEWLRMATKKNLFNVQAPVGPDSRRPGGKPPVDFDNMSPQAIMALGYSKK